MPMRRIHRCLGIEELEPRVAPGWAELGVGSAIDGGMTADASHPTNTGDSYHPSIAFGADWNPIVAWEDGWHIYVRRWNGSSWAEYASSGGAGTGSASGSGISRNSGWSRDPVIRVGGDLNPIVAWTDESSGDYEIYVRKWNGSSWVEMGTGSATGGGISSNTGDSGGYDVYNQDCGVSMAVGTDGYPIVAWHDNTSGNYEIYVRKWSGSSWVEYASSGGAGTGSASGGGISNNALNSVNPAVTIGADGRPAVFWGQDTSGDGMSFSNEIYARRWDGSSWVEYASSGGAGTGSASGEGISHGLGWSQHPSATRGSDGQPIVAWTDFGLSGSFEIHVQRWNGTSWVEMGAGSASGGGISNNPTASQYPCVTVGPSGVPFVAWQDAPRWGCDVYVRQWDGVSWVETDLFPTGSASGGGVSNNTGYSQSPSIAVGTDGNPIVAWNDDSNSPGQILANREIYVSRYVPTTGLPVVSVAATDPNAMEQWVPGDTGTFLVTRSGSTSGALVVQYTVEGTATPGTDYTALSGSVTIGNGAGSAEIAVSPLWDLDWGKENSETVRIRLSTSGTYLLANSSRATVTIASREAPGGSWVEIGAGSASNGGINWDSGWGESPCMALGTDGYPVAAWANQDVTGLRTEVFVLKWNGSSWAELGVGSASGGGISNAYSATEPCIAMGKDGKPIVAWTNMGGGSASEIYLRRWNGSSWVETGGTASAGGISANTGSSMSAALAVGTDGNPVVAWSDSSGGDWEIYVRRWNGSSWVALGASASAGGVSNNTGHSWEPCIAVGTNGNPIVTWRDNSGSTIQIYVRRWSGSAWVEMGTGSATGSGISKGSFPASTPTMAVGTDGNPIVAWHDTHGEIYVRRWNGSTWAEYASSGGAGTGSATGGGISNNTGYSDYPSIAIGKDGNPVVAWSDSSNGSKEIYLRRWDGSSWSQVGTRSATGRGVSEDASHPTSTAGNSVTPTLVVGLDGNPIVAWVENDMWYPWVAVCRWDGSPYVTSLSVSPDPVTRPNEVTIAPSGVTDLDGTVGGISLYWDLNGNGSFDWPGDRLIAADSNGADGWVFHIPTVGVEHFPAGPIMYFAVAMDNSPKEGPATSATGVILNARPTIGSFVASPNPVVRPNDVTLTADGVIDPDWLSILSVEFYRDANGNGTLEPGPDVLLGVDSVGTNGWSWTGATWTFPGGEYAVFARAQDGDHEWGPAASVLLSAISPPEIGSLTASPARLNRGDTLTLTANAVTDEDGQVTLVQFYHDVNDNGDLEIGTDVFLGSATMGTGGNWAWSGPTTAFPYGSNRFLARARDNDNAWSNVRSDTVEVNTPPTINALLLSRDRMKIGDPITLTASGAMDTDGSVALVVFYRETNGMPGLQTAGDMCLGTDGSSVGGWEWNGTMDAPTGGTALYAVARDNEGLWSNIISRNASVYLEDPVDVTSVFGLSSTRFLSNQPGHGEIPTLNRTFTASVMGPVSRVEFQLGSTVLTDTNGADDWKATFDLSAIGTTTDELVVRAYGTVDPNNVQTAINGFGAVVLPDWFYNDPVQFTATYDAFDGYDLRLCLAELNEGFNTPSDWPFIGNLRTGFTTGPSFTVHSPVSGVGVTVGDYGYRFTGEVLGWTLVDEDFPVTPGFEIPIAYKLPGLGPKGVEVKASGSISVGNFNIDLNDDSLEVESTSIDVGLTFGLGCEVSKELMRQPILSLIGFPVPYIADLVVGIKVGVGLGATVGTAITHTTEGFSWTVGTLGVGITGSLAVFGEAQLLGGVAGKGGVELSGSVSQGLVRAYNPESQTWDLSAPGSLNATMRVYVGAGWGCWEIKTNLWSHKWTIASWDFLNPPQEGQSSGLSTPGTRASLPEDTDWQKVPYTGSHVAGNALATGPGGVECAYIAGDTNGAAVYVQTGDGTGGWSVPHALTNTDCLKQHPTMAYGADGDLYVGWMQSSIPISNQDDYSVGDRAASQEIYYAKRHGSAWGAPVAITSDGQVDANPEIAFSPVGTSGIIVWERGIPDDGTWVERRSSEIAYSWWDGSSWGPVETLTTNAYADWGVDVAYTAAGSPVIVWLSDPDRDYIEGEGLPTTAVSYAVWDGVEWDMGILAPDGSTFNQWARVIRTGGTMMAAWVEAAQNEGYSLKERTYSGGTWGAPQVIIEHETMISNPSVTVDGSDQIYVTYTGHRNGQSDAYVIKGDGLGGWLKPTRLTEDGLVQWQTVVDVSNLLVFRSTVDDFAGGSAPGGRFTRDTGLPPGADGITASTSDLTAPDIVITTADGTMYLDLGPCPTAGNRTTEAYFTVSNEGNAALTFAGINLTDTINYSIQWDGNGTAPATVAPGESRTAMVVFNPTTEGAHTAGIALTTNDPDEGSISLTLTGRGAGEPPAIASLTDGPDPVGKPYTLTLTAQGVTDPDADLTRVDFYQDANGNGVLDLLTDLLLGTDTSDAGGWVWSGPTGSLPLGKTKYFAIAQDADGLRSNVAIATGFVHTAIPLASGKQAQFQDGDEGLVTALLSGPGGGYLTLANGLRTGAAISAMYLEGTTDKSSLTITCKGGLISGTSIALLDINRGTGGTGAGAMGTVSLKGVTLGDGAMLETEGAVKSLTIGPIGGGARVSIGGSLGSFTGGRIENDVLFDVTGDLGTFSVASVGNDAHIHATGGIKTVNVLKGDMLGNIIAGAATGIGTISIPKGMLDGLIDSAGPIKTLTVGSTAGLFGEVSSKGTAGIGAGIGTITVSKGPVSANIHAEGGIKTITVGGGTLSGSVTAGGTAGIGTITISKGGLAGTISATNAKGGIKTVTVGGTVGIAAGSSIIANGTAGIGTITVSKGGLNGVIEATHVLGGIKTLNILGAAGIAAGSRITAAGTAGIGTMNVKGDIVGTTISALGGAIKTLSAGHDITGASWIEALCIGSLTVKRNLGDGTSPINIKLTKTAALEPRNKPAKDTLGSLTVSGWVRNTLLDSAGHVGTIKVGAVTNSAFFAGIAENPPDYHNLPNPATSAETYFTQPGAAVPHARIKSFTVSGILNETHGNKGPLPRITDTYIAAYEIGTFTLGYAATAGDTCGVAAYLLKAGSYTSETKPNWKYNPKTMGTVGDVLSDGSLVVRLLE